MKRFVGDFTPESYEFMQQNAADLWDFKTCVYPDGTGYGIAAGKECRKAPEGELKGEAKLVSVLNSLYANKGVKPNAKQLAKSVEAINSIFESGDEARAEALADNLSTFLPSSGGRKANTMTVEEVKALQKQDFQTKLNDAFTNDPTSLIGGSNSIIDFKKVSDQELDDVMSVLPPKMRKMFDGVGKPDNKAWAGTDEDGNAINGGNGSPERGRELMRLWLSQKGKCAYTGLDLPLDYADLEHIRPLLKTGPAAENPKNWVFTLRSVNQIKGDKDMDDFLQKSVNSVTDFDAHQKKFDSAAQGSAGKDVWRDRAKNAQIYSELKDNRRLVIDAFEGAKHLDYLAAAIGRQKLDDNDDITFSREVNREGERNATKGLLYSKGTFTAGAVSGKMPVAKWIAENYPDLSTSDKAKVKRIYEDVKNELRSNQNPYANTGAGFGRRLSERINEELSQ